MKTKRIHLKPFDLEKDIPFHIELMNSEHWLKYVGDRNIHSEKDFLDFYEIKFRENAEKGYLNFVIYHNETNEKLGTCGLYKRESLLVADIGYGILPKYECKGYISEVIPLIVNYYFENFPSENVISAFIDPENIASEKVLLKSGFEKIDERSIPPYEGLSTYFEYTKH